MKVFCGTPQFMSPEIVSKKGEYDGPAADIWAVGVCMYIILTGHIPYKADDEKGLYRKIQKGHYSVPLNAAGEKISAEAMDLLQNLLSFDPQLRISAEVALSHPWIAN